MLRLALAAASTVLALAAGTAQATPFTLDHLFGLERFGQASLSPSGDTLVFERIGPLLDGAPYQYDALGLVRRSRPFLVPTLPGSRPRPLLDEAEGRGVVIGGWSPDARRLLVYRLGERTLSAGIVDPHSHQLRWLTVAPDLSLWGRNAQWRNPDELVMILRPDGDLPALLRAGYEPASQLSQLWARTRRGDEPGLTLIGGGGFADLNPKSPNNQLALLSAETGAIRTLASGRFHDLEVSPDGRFAAAVRFTEDRPFDPSRPFLQGDFTERRELTLVDLQTGEGWEPLPGEDLIPHLLSWSPSGERLLVWARRDGEPWSDGRLIQIDARRRTAVQTPLGGLIPALVQTGLRTEIVCADWVGEDPILYVRNGERRDWALLSSAGPRILTEGLTSPTSSLAAVAADRFVVQSDGVGWSVGADGDARRLGRVERPGVTVTGALFSQGQRFQFNNPPRQTWVMVGDDARRQRIDIRSGRTGGPASSPEGQIAAVSETLLVSRESDAQHREALIIGGMPLLRLNPVLSEVAFARPEAVHHQASDGSPQVGWLYRAARSDDRRPPLIIIPYPGGPARAPGPVDETVMTNVQVMVSAGYAVLIPSLSRLHHHGEPARGMADDILAAVDAAAASQAFDSDRIVLWGHSFGAFAAVAAATQSDRFSAVIAANGPYDLLSVWGQFPLASSLSPADGLAVRSRAGWVETGQGGLGAPPYLDADRYLRNSPIFRADRISAPVLLFTADRDYVPPGQAEELFSALYRQQKDVVLVTYRGEGHVLSSPANIRAFYDTIWRWLDEVLARPKATFEKNDGPS